MNPKEYAEDLRSWAHVNEDEDSYEMSERLRGAADARSTTPQSSAVGARPRAWARSLRTGRPVQRFWTRRRGRDSRSTPS